MPIMPWLAEQRILEAMREGEFDNLAGSGKPLELEDLSGVPEELRMSFKILKNAGILPEELAVQQECVRLEEMLSVCLEEEREALKSQLTAKQLKLRELMQSRGLNSNPAFAEYSDRIYGRLT